MGNYTLEKYGELCSVLDASRVFEVGSFLKEKPESNFSGMGHDVNRKPGNALKMAELNQKVMK